MIPEHMPVSTTRSLGVWPHWITGRMTSNEIYDASREVLCSRMEKHIKRRGTSLTRAELPVQVERPTVEQSQSIEMISPFGRGRKNSCVCVGKGLAFVRSL